MITFIRRFGLWFLSFLLIVVLFLGSIFWTLNHSVADKEVVKSYLSGSQTYKVAIDSAIKNFDINKQLNKDSSSNNQQNNDPNKDLSNNQNNGSNQQNQDGNNIDPEAVKTAITASLTPQTLQKVAESVIDGFYNWLNGQDKKVEFSVDLSVTKATFVDAIVSYARNKVSTLADCSPAQLQQETDIFSIACKPPTAVIDQSEADLRKQLNSDEFFPDTVVTDKTVFNSDTKSPTDLRFDEQNSDVPYYFGQARQIFTWLMILAVALAFFVAFLGKNIRKGIGHVIKVFIIGAMLVSVVAILINVGSSSVTVDKFVSVGETDSSKLIGPEIAVNFVNYVGPKVAEQMFKPVIGYTVVALLLSATLVILHKLKKKNDKAVPAESAPEDNKPDVSVEKAKETVQSIDTKEEEKPEAKPVKKPVKTFSDIKPPKIQG